MIEYRDLVETIYNTIHKEGWRWANLTNGEQAEAAAPILEVLRAIYEHGGKIVWLETEKPKKVKTNVLDAPGPCYPKYPSTSGAFIKHRKDMETNRCIRCGLRWD